MFGLDWPVEVLLAQMLQIATVMTQMANAMPTQHQVKLAQLSTKWELKDVSLDQQIVLII